MKSVSCGTGFLLLLLTQCTLQDDIDESVTVEVEEDDIYVTPTPIGNPFIAETFDDTQAFKRKWQTSQAKKDGIDEDLAKYDGVWEVEAPLKEGLKNDLGLVLKSKAKHAAISAKLNRPFTFQEKPLIVQYEVNFQEGQECGGAYVKLLSHGTHGPQSNLLKEFTDKTPYTIMFGPDKCGNDIKLHFIFRHLNPNNGSLEEKHCKKPKDRLQEVFDDKRPHLYTLILNPDNTFLIKVDHKIVNEGSLLEDFTPSVNPPAEIDDPNDKKPASWDEREKIVDPEAVKPDDWDESAPRQIPDPHASKPGDWLENEPTMLPDPDAEKPTDWDTDMDGDWEAPLVDNPACLGLSGCGPWEHPNIDNPAYKGKWRAPLIDNPNYQGKWRPRRIPNPDYFFDGTPFKMTPIGAVGFELWSMSSSILFDNIIVADSLEVADDFATKTYDLKKRKIEAESDSVLTAFLKYSNERPYLYGVYILLIGLPIALIVVYCCGTPTRDQDDSREHPKKTDTPQPDSPPVVRSKDDLNVPEEEEDQDEEDEDGDEQGSSPDEEEEDEEEEEDVQKEATPDSTGARQRKPRKE